MTDFYSVLMTSLKKRDLWDPAERERLYTQARTAMIKTMSSYQPALPDGEIAAKIGVFDAAVDRIENELADEMATHQPEPSSYPPEETYASPEADTSAAPHLPAIRPPSPAARRTAAGTAALLPEPEPDLDAAGAEPFGDDIENQDAGPQATRTLVKPRSPQRRGRGGESAQRPALDWQAPPEPTPAAPDEYDYDYVPVSPGESDAYDFAEGDPDAAEADAASSRKQGRVAWRAPDRNGPARGVDLRGYLGRSVARLRRERGDRSPIEPVQPTKRRGIGRYIMLLLLALAIGVAAQVALVLYPIFFPSQPAVVVGEETPAAPTTGGGSAPAAAPASVEQRIDLFDGQNPTVFVSSSDNPIRFSGDAEGGFARIASSAGSPGARAVIGPGVAEQLLGRVVRVAIEVRTSQDTGAASLRFAYQAGTTLSPWKTAPLTDRYARLELIWQVPPGAGRGSQYVVIEPGIPGGGSGADIRSITIEALKS